MCVFILTRESESFERIMGVVFLTAKAFYGIIFPEKYFRKYEKHQRQKGALSDVKGGKAVKPICKLREE